FQRGLDVDALAGHQRAVLGAALAQQAGELAGVDAGDGDHAAGGQPILQRRLAAPVAGTSRHVAHDQAGRPDLGGLVVLPGAAGVADMGIGQGDQLARIGRIGHDLLVAGHGGVEHHFAHGQATGAYGFALEHGAVFEDEDCGMGHVVRLQVEEPCRRPARGRLQKTADWHLSGPGMGVTGERELYRRRPQKGTPPFTWRMVSRVTQSCPKSRPRMVYRPGGRPASTLAACSAPRAKMSRLVARWTSSTRSPCPANCTVCSPTMSPARRLAYRGSAPPRTAASPRVRAVPEGASFLCTWCCSTMSQSQPTSARAACSTSSFSTATPTLKLEAQSTGIVAAACSSAWRCPAEMPVVPETSGRRRFTHCASTGSKPSGRLKSMATSKSGTPDSSAAANCGMPSTTRCSGARPATAATTCQRSGASAASRSRARPMRPEAP